MKDCRRRSLTSRIWNHDPVDSLQFSYHGKAIGKDDTPAGLGMTADDAVIQVSGDAPGASPPTAAAGPERAKETLAQACMAGAFETAAELLSEDKDLISAPLGWFDSDGDELTTPPIFICVDYGHVDAVAALLPLHEGILDTLKSGSGDYSALSWASWTVRRDES